MTPMQGLRIARRLPLLLVLVVAGVLIQFLSFAWLTVPQRRATIRHWSRALMWACGIEVRVREAYPGTLVREAPGHLLVANHISWLDIFAINAATATSFVAKVELRDWPVVGLLIRWAGTVFVDRSQRAAVPAVIEQMVQRMGEGFPVGLFPEGTTHNGVELLPFRASLLQAAIDSGRPVIPVALRFSRPDGALATEALYIGDTGFVESVLMILGAQALRVDVMPLPAVPVAGQSRQHLADQCRTAIIRRLATETADSGAARSGGTPGASR